MGLSGLNFPVPSTNSSQSSLGYEQSWGSTLKAVSSGIVHSLVAILICYKNYHSRRPFAVTWAAFVLNNPQKNESHPALQTKQSYTSHSPQRAEMGSRVGTSNVFIPSMHQCGGKINAR